MPQYHLPMGTEEAQATYAALDAFTRGYVEAMFFTSCGPDDEELADKSFSDLSAAALEQIKRDCFRFQVENRADLEAAYSYAPVKYDEERAGRDFWYTRNGHGTGFWDRGLGKGDGDYMVGDKLTKAANA